MKKILYNWKKYLKEREKQGKLTIYCDMDGVLTDFGNTMLNILRNELHKPRGINKELVIKFNHQYGMNFQLSREQLLPSTKLVYIRDMMYNVMNDNTNFWATLPWTRDGKQLWNFLKEFNPSILTTPPDWAAIEGKKKWIQRELGLSLSRAFFEENKYIYASKTTLLIDDFETNTVPFEKAGGSVILHTSAEKTIKQMKILIQQNEER